MKTLGICFGATTMQCAVVVADPEVCSVVRTERIAHEGNPRRAFLDFIERLDPYDIDRIAITGRNFRQSVALTGISEPEAIEYALHEECRNNRRPDLILSLGGETQLVYRVGPTGGLISVHSGNKCASGTGEFFVQQIRRMGLGLDEAVGLAREGTPRKIAGRCSVFCKSDCTHALNKGESRANIAAGLCTMMADKVDELIGDLTSDKLMVVGGGSLNTALVDLLRARHGKVLVPEHAAVFEAYGAALWAARHPCKDLPEHIEDVLHDRGHSFAHHPPLADSMHRVSFKEWPHEQAKSGDTCILGLDVGSTTTKAVLIRRNDARILASVYLRTEGDPVGASRCCYEKIAEQVNGADLSIIGLGVTGSGRRIAALHAQTHEVINEITCHAVGAAFFDPAVDTIFEIGGQDAKYTFLTEGVPSDYAMNEACSAGTGSFLEESARESLNVLTERIGELAVIGNNPPNFTDQCAAFISSDIKRAGQEGVSREDILAGLVYSICLNYLNRVKGNRPVGSRIFMQGGVCYNRALPVAMASLMDVEIVVPPDPGLVGAFGVALEVRKRLETGQCEPGRYDLGTLVARDARREGYFTCAGGPEKCDRACRIARIRIDDKLYPFGGICDRYDNAGGESKVGVAELDLVARRRKLLFETYGPSRDSHGPKLDKTAPTVGLNRSFMAHQLYPLFSNFFSGMGFRVVMSNPGEEPASSRADAAFCLPAHIAHAGFQDLLDRKVDYVFVPQIMTVPVANVPTYSRACVFVQGEPYYLKTTFRREIAQSGCRILSPVLKMQKGYENAMAPLTAIAVEMGVSEKTARHAWSYACEKQRSFESALLREGKKALYLLGKDPERIGMVLFGRPYNAWATEANMGIPHKIASRGYMVIPHDMLPVDDYGVDHKMFWAMGQKVMKAAKFVKERPNLFGTYITNFSCGPDSFLLTYFRNVMGRKPSLTLELDQHTADAGIDTRIEAALDIMNAYGKTHNDVGVETPFVPAHIVYDQTPTVYTSDGHKYALNDPHVEIVLPSMGKYGTESLAAVLKGLGIRTKALPVADDETLRIGRKHTSGKECLPYIVTTGSFLRHISERTDPETVTLFFLATGGGPCRLGQYCRALDLIIRRNRIPNAAVFTMTDENGYSGLGARSLLRAWQGIVLSDVFSDIRSMAAVAAREPAEALRVVEESRREVLRYLEGRLSVRLTSLLSVISRRLSRIPLKAKPRDVPTVSLVGEIFVRSDEFSRRDLVDYLEKRGMAVRVAPVAEYMCYSHFVVNNGLGEREFGIGESMKMRLTARVQEWWERRIKQIMSGSGLYRFEMIEVDKTIRGIGHLLNENFRGECILTVGLAMREILNDSCGVISIGPFGCMYSRMAEAMLKREMDVAGKSRMSGWGQRAKAFADLDVLPFLAIETDGNPFPQLIEANLEAFVLQARRVHHRLQELSGRIQKTGSDQVNSLCGNKLRSI
ncbi:MAG: activase [Chitinivibrionales bacterium]|nr:activase [Chitinivibrionales bacterium]MBD3358706.1 activase [Chitinivibrionales bacterium]